MVINIWNAVHQQLHSADCSLGMQHSMQQTFEFGPGQQTQDLRLQKNAPMPVLACIQTATNGLFV